MYLKDLYRLIRTIITIPKIKVIPITTIKIRKLIFVHESKIALQDVCITNNLASKTTIK